MTVDYRVEAMACDVDKPMRDAKEPRIESARNLLWLIFWVERLKSNAGWLFNRVGSA